MRTLEDTSKALFGNSYRLELLAVVAEFDGPFYARALAKELGIADNLVSTQLANLLEAGLLRRRPSPDDARTVLYERAESSVWEMASRLRSELEQGDDQRGAFAFDGAARQDAHRRAYDAMLESAAIVGVDGRVLSELVAAIIDSVLAGSARTGLSLSELCESRLGVGQVRDHLGPEVGAVSDLAARLIQAEQGRPVIHEELFSLPTRVSRATNVIGADKQPGRGRGAHELGVALSSGDRHLPARAMAFVTATRDDRTSERANPSRIAALEAELGQPIAATLGEHVEHLLRATDELRRRAEQALDSRPAHLQGLGLDPDHFSKHYFPRLLVLDALPYGPPQQRGHSSSGVLYPGDDPETLSVLADSTRHGIVRCNNTWGESASPEQRRDVVSGISERYGDEPVELGPRHVEALGQSPLARQLGVSADWGTRYWWLRRTGVLIKLSEMLSRQGDTMGFETDVWRWFGDPPGADSGPAAFAVVLAESANQRWRHRCLRRFESDCAPGRIQSTKSSTKRSLMALSIAANAAIVAADRARQARGSQERIGSPPALTNG